MMRQWRLAEAAGSRETAEAEVCLLMADDTKILIPLSSALNRLGNKLEDALDLHPNDELGRGSTPSDIRFTGAIRLREKVLKDGKVLPNQILDVSAFMNSFVDVDMMDACAMELAERFKALRPSKILTVATTGLILAIPMGRILQIPVVYARKQRSVVMADSYIAGYSSKNHGSNR